MKSFVIIMTVGFAAVARAQEQCAAVAAKVPTCAVSCIQSAASGVGCGSTDFACQCKPSNNAAINSAALDCVVKGCGPVTGLAVQGSASAVCACAATAAAAPISATAAPASSVEASSTAEASPSSAPVIASSARPATSSAPYPTTTVPASPAASAPSASGTGAVSPSSSTTPFTGTGVKAMASLSAVVGALLAIIAAL